MLTAQTQVAPAEAAHGIPAPTFGSDSDAGFKIIQITYVHLVSTQKLIYYSD